MEPNNSQHNNDSPELSKLQEDLQKLTKEAIPTTPIPQTTPSEVYSEAPHAAPPTLPEQTKKGISLISVAIILLTVALIVAGGFIVYANFFVKVVLSTTPTPVSLDQNILPTNVPATSGIPAGQGMVTGKLCYPSSVLPAGSIVAKNTLTQKIFNQDYLGSQAGGSSIYSFNLDPGIYNLKYQVASATDSSTFVSGYYTACGSNPQANVCDSDSNHKLISVTVAVGQTADKVDLCDFYGNQTQQTAMDQSF